VVVLPGSPLTIGSLGYNVRLGSWVAAGWGPVANPQSVLEPSVPGEIGMLVIFAVNFAVASTRLIIGSRSRAWCRPCDN